MRALCGRCVVGAVCSVLIAGANVSGQPLSNPRGEDLRAWMQQMPLPGGRLRELPISRQLLQTDEIRPFAGASVGGIGLTGSVRFNGARGLARVVVVDTLQQEHLVFETFPLIAGTDVLEIRDACRETCLLSGSTPLALKIELIDATLIIQSVVVNDVTGAPGTLSAAQASASSQTVKDGDGYFNWGTGSDGRSACGNVPPIEDTVNVLGARLAATP